MLGWFRTGRNTSGGGASRKNKQCGEAMDTFHGWETTEIEEPRKRSQGWEMEVVQVPLDFGIETAARQTPAA